MPSTVRSFLVLCTTLTLTLALAAGAESGDEAAAKTAGPRSIGQLAFSPEGVLFAADSHAAAVYAFELADEDPPPSAELPRIDELDEKVAALLATAARDILIHDLAVHPRSKNVYLSVSRGRGADARPALVKVDDEGALSLVELESLARTRAAIDNAPAEDAKDRRGRPMRGETITDLAWADGQVFVAGLSNEEFASHLRRIPYPFGGEMRSSSIEIYHGAHGEFETHAPIRTFMPYEIAGKAHLLASYTCTPLVTMPLDKLVDGAHVKGETIGELGFGNRPLDMVAFRKEGEPYVLILNSNRAGMRIKSADIAKAGPVPTEVEITSEAPLAGVPYVSVPMGGVLRADNYDDRNLVVLRRDVVSGVLHLRLWPTEWI